MKLITWNTQWCCGLDGRVNLKRIVNEARSMGDFDVLCLQEIACGFVDLAGHPGDQPAQLQALLPGYAVFFGAAVDEWNVLGKRQRFGNLIATRLPLASVQHHPLPWPADAGVRSMPRMCTEVTVTDPGLGAVRIMTTHLEFYSARQRMAQAQALRALHMQACEQAAAQPLADDSDSPFQSKTHTRHAILCGDFNFEPGAPEYAAIQQPFRPLELMDNAQEAINIESEHLQDAWPLMLGQTPHAPTFRLFDRTYGPEPITCDYVFVSQSLVPRLKSLSVNLNSRASDHQPLWMELA
ncbi:MAG: endonuclease/exonuclease/phosphatase [Comamonadaceae bacterium]|nr:MAG: endonuclease/exonuclease/phosphatase [Comamonadaceae bacterium]